MRQVRFPPFGFGFSEFGLQDPVLALFLAFFDFQQKGFRGGPSRKMRQVRFPPFGFGFSEFGLGELLKTPVLAFFDFRIFSHAQANKFRYIHESFSN